MSPAEQHRTVGQRRLVLDELTAAVHPVLPELPVDRLSVMVTDWLRHTRDEDLAALPLADLGELVTAQVQLGRTREPGECLVHVRRPSRPGGPTIVQVVTDDRPFIVDTIAMALTGAGWRIVDLLHPQFHVRRDSQGQLCDASREPDEDTVAESWVGVLAAAPLGDSYDHLVPELERRLRLALGHLAQATDDYQPMRDRMVELADELASVPADQARVGTAEAVDHLRWLAADHFTFLGYREFLFTDDGAQPVPGTGLGIERGVEEPDVFNAVPTYDPVLTVALTKHIRHSDVHRGTLMDYVGVRLFDQDGNAVGERRFIGLLGQGAYSESVRAIPLLRRKADEILARSGYAPGTHGANAIWQVLDTFPRDELFNATIDELEPVVATISQLKERRQVRLFVRESQWPGRATALVYFPRDRYNTQVRERMQRILVKAFGATSIDHQSMVGESVLARLYFTLELPTDTGVDVDVASLEALLTEATRAWDDAFTELAAQMPSDQRGIVFPDAYREAYSARQALADLAALNGIADADGMAMAMYAPDDPEDTADLRLKVMRVGAPMQLQDVMPHLGSLGVRVVDEHPFELALRGQQAMVYDFGLRLPGGVAGWDLASRRRFSEAFEASWQGRCEVDDLNALVSEAGFTWRQVLLLRAISRYLQQLRSTYSQAYIAKALRANQAVARHLVEYFEARFDPSVGEDRDRLADERHAALLAELDSVASLDHDRILRHFVEVVQATVRTNLYSDDQPAFAMKVLPREISLAPQPRPEFEIFVHSPRVEGVHLRFGAVARGGLRWSDRPEDFRTEVLGLVKAQMVKNTVIVPVGAKGGFFPRHLPNPADDRAGWLAEGQACYRIFIGSLLSLTDNIVDSQVVPPRDVVRHDGDDPYLVVAADKGTATFSDLANSIALERGFWLRDAFASGGSVGYDHKGMGITARGAWESVKHHFRELGVDCQTTDFTCVGIGDMAGDVFGNGMLLSEHTRLVAAFNHMHIFLDPNPDGDTSFAERRRLFELPRSTWADYDASLISQGGGVHSRQAKSIAITPEVRTALGLDEAVAALTPTELIRAILAAPVDLLWNGGIGTYVKSSDESHLDVGDKANDAVRRNGDEIRARVAGEGGNLGWTQLGRIQYAQAGGRINTDFIDNSAGVDTSDHEVNIKILLDSEVAAGRLTPEDRNALLPQMTDDVARLVLSHNIDQNLALANARAGSVMMAGVHEDWMAELVDAGYLDRTVENMPSTAEMRRRISDGRGLTSPELATLLAWSKIWLADQILASDLPDDPFVADRLVQYFPPLLRERYRDRMPQHRLHREIITTVAVNRFVNSQGMTACHRLGDETSAMPADVMRAQLAGRSIFEAGRLEVNTRRAALDARTQTDMRVRLRVLVERGARWLLHRHPTGIDVQATIDRYHEGVQQLALILPDLLAPRQREVYETDLASVMAAGVDETLARVAVGAPWAHFLLACVAIAQEQDRDPVLVARVFFAQSEQLGLDRLLARIEALPRTNKWATMARSALRDDLLGVQSQLASQAFRGSVDGQDPTEIVERWWAAVPGAAQRARTLTQILDDEPDLARMSVGLRTVRALVVNQ